MQEGFPENHDDPTTWPYWSTTFRRNRELSSAKMPSHPNHYSKEDIHTVEAFERSDSESLEAMLKEVDEEVKLIQSSLNAVLRQRRLLKDAISKRSENSDPQY